MVIGVLGISYIIISFVVSIIVARKKVVQQKCLGEKNILEELPNEVIEEMKTIAQNIFECKQIPFEESKKYEIRINVKNEKIDEVSVAYKNTIITVNNDNEVGIITHGYTKESATMATIVILVCASLQILVLLGLIAIIGSIILQIL